MKYILLLILWPVFATAEQNTPATLVVNTTGDTSDEVCDETHCSLRDAITAANSTTGIHETITFDIPGTPPHTLMPQTPLPIITDPVTIDGASQPGYDGTPIIVIDGTLLGTRLNINSIGLNIAAGNSTVHGMAVNNFAFAGINLSLGGSNTITGSYIGVAPDGTTAAGNRDGIRICASSNNHIGGTHPAESNVISGNWDDGINLCRVPLLPLSSRNMIVGNIIGMDASGTAALGNGDDGIKIEDATHTTVGGEEASAYNLIAANGTNGIRLSGTRTTGSRLLGNTFGTEFSNGRQDVAVENGAQSN